MSDLKNMRIFVVKNNIIQNDLYNGVEEYIRNYRAPANNHFYTEDDSYSSLCYRFPYRTNNHIWKLIKDHNKPPNILSIIPKNSENFSYTECVDVDLLVAAELCDKQKNPTIQGSAIWCFDKVTKENPLNSLQLFEKNNKGHLVNSKQCLYYNENNIEHDFTKHNTMILSPMAMFKLNNLPIYTIILNNNFIVNKVLFETSADDFIILAENEGNTLVKDILFNVGMDIKQINKTTWWSDKKTVIVDLLSFKKWNTYNGIHQEGSELGLRNIIVGNLNDNTEVDTNCQWKWIDCGKIELTLNSQINFLNIKINTGPFWENCVDKNENFNFDNIIFYSDVSTMV